MRDPVARFGTFAGIDAGGGYTAGNDSWLSSLEEMNALAQRDAFIPVRQLTDGLATTSSGLIGLGNLYAQPRLRAMLDKAGFGLINNCGGEVVNPVKGSTGSEAVTGVGTIGTGDDALVWHETNKPNNARWKYSVMANAYPNKYPLSVFLVGNEPDGNGTRLSAYAPTGVGTNIDGFTQVSQLDRTELLRRLALLQRQAYEELRGPNRRWAKQKHPSVVASYANTGTCMQDANPPGGISYSVYHFFKYNNGEFLTTCDVIANHFHNLASTFDTSGVANTTVSPWHLWTAIQQEQALAGTGAIHPIYCNEGGVRESKLPANLPPGTGNYQKNALNSNMDTVAYPDGDDPEHTQHRRLLKVRRTGMMLCTMFYWGHSAWFLYNHNASGDDGMIWCPSPNFTPREPCWSAIKRQFDPHNYLLSGRWPWALTITAKPWADLTDTSTQASVGFHDPVTWAILGDLHKAEKAVATSPTDRTWYEWDRATITDNHIVFTAPVAGRGNQLNRAMRPVILPGHGRYKVSCSFPRNTGTAKLIARGYNAVDGLVATTASSTAASGTLTTTFTTVPHNVRNFPNLPKVAVVLECTAAADYSDPIIAPA